ncbi:hypothetical protein [Streptomyces sp. NBC_00344]|uniref:hypothetical protein n=1 Tax=Streptomyces sp. NBC_00344 TaxID=2975720 RepID=UPI002E21E081
MQTMSNNPSAARPHSTPLLAGAALTVSGAGAALALSDLASPLRAPFTLFFLFVAPVAGISAALRGVEPFTRLMVSSAGAMALDALVAEIMLTADIWSARSGVAAIAAISSLLLLLPPVRHRRRER